MAESGAGTSSTASPGASDGLQYAAAHGPEQRPKTPWIPLHYHVDELILVHKYSVLRFQIPDGSLYVPAIEKHFKIHDIELNGVREKVDWDGFTRKRYAAWSIIRVTGKPGAPSSRPTLEALGDQLNWICSWAKDSLTEMWGSRDDAGSKGAQQRARPSCAAEPSASHPEALELPDAIPWIPGVGVPELLMVHGTRTARFVSADGQVNVRLAARLFKLTDVELNGIREKEDAEGYTVKQYPLYSTIIVTGKPVRPEGTSAAQKGQAFESTKQAKQD